MLQKIVKIGSVVCLCACGSQIAHLNRGDALLAKGLYAEAVSEYQLVLDGDATSAEALAGMARAHIRAGKLQEAQKTIDEGLQLENRVPALLALGELRHLQGRYLDAAHAYKQLLRRAPEHGQAHYQLGAVQLDAEDPRTAIDNLRMAVSLEPRLFDAWLKLAQGLRTINEDQDAIVALQEARPIFGGKRRAILRARLGAIYESRADLPIAERNFKAALALDGKCSEALAGMARLLRGSNRYPEAVELLMKALRRAPNSALLHYELGITYRDYKMLDRAFEELQKAVELDAGIAEAYAPLFELMSEHPDFEEKRYRLLARGAKALKGDFRIQLLYGKAAYKRKQYTSCLAAMTRAITLDPADTDANYYLGMAQVRTSRIEDARDSYDALLTVDPDKANELLAAINSAAMPVSEPRVTDNRPAVKTAKRRRRAARRKNARRRRRR